MNKKINTEKNFQEPDISFLKDIKKKPFTTPDGYFNQLEVSIASNINSLANSKKNVISMRWKYVGIAASIALIVGLSFIIMRKSTLSIAESEMMVSTQDATEFLLENVDDLDFETLYSCKNNSVVEDDVLDHIKEIDLDDVDETTILNLF